MAFAEITRMDSIEQYRKSRKDLDKLESRAKELAGEAKRLSKSLEASKLGPDGASAFLELVDRVVSKLDALKPKERQASLKSESQVARMSSLFGDALAEARVAIGNEKQAEASAQKSADALEHIDTERPEICFPTSYFQLGEVFEFLGTHLKTGHVLLRADDEIIRVTLREGRIVGAKDGTCPEHMRLGQILVRSGAITQHDLDLALDEARTAGIPVGRRLLASRLVDSKVLTDALREQAREFFLRALTLPIDVIVFRPCANESLPVGDIELPLDSVLLAGMVLRDTLEAERAGDLPPGSSPFA